jgi:hypothetical protein
MIGPKASVSGGQLRASITKTDADASISCVVPVVNANYVKLRAAIAVVDAQANISYVMPAVGIRYIQLEVAASLDTLNKNPFTADSFVIFDTAALLAAKNFYDSVISTSELKSYTLGKNIADSASVSENINVLLVFIRNFADIANISDSKALAYIKSLANTVTVSDDDTYLASKKVSDGVAMQDGADATDGNVTNVSKYVMNMAFPIDAWAKDVQKALLDSQNILERPYISFARPVADSFTVFDSNSFITDIGKTDTVSTTESRFYDFFKGISSDSIAFSDQMVKNSVKGLSDSAAPDDAGWLYAQNYCDITYFLEDYVGEYRTFT